MTVLKTLHLRYGVDRFYALRKKGRNLKVLKIVRMPDS